MAWEGKIITVAAGTPVQLSPFSLIVASLSIQMLAGASGGIGYVMPGVRPLTTPTANTSPTIQLAPAATDSPGGQYTGSDPNGSTLDLALFFVDGAHTGDLIGVVYDTKSR